MIAGGAARSRPRPARPAVPPGPGRRRRRHRPGPGPAAARGAGQRLGRRPGAAARTTATRSSESAAPAPLGRGRGGHRQHRALDRLGDRRVGRLGGRGPAPRPAARPPRPPVRRRAPRRSRAGVCETITPELPRAPSSAPRAMQRSTRPSRASSPVGRLAAVRLGDQRLLGRGEGQHQVGAGVAVGDRVDVQLVDLVLVPAQRGQPGRRTSGARRRRPGVSSTAAIMRAAAPGCRRTAPGPAAIGPCPARDRVTLSVARRSLPGAVTRRSNPGDSRG